MPILHAYTLTQADGTATSVVRPSDWNSNHNIAYHLSGNTAGSSQVSGSNVVLVGGNNVTLSADTANSRVVFSGANQTQQPMAFSAGGASTTANTIQFANSNGVSFGLTNGSISASYTVPVQSAQPVAISGSNGSFAFSTLTLGNLNGVSFYTSNGSVVASYTVPGQTVQTQNMVSVLGSTGNISFANGNGITFGGNASTVTASHNGLTTAALSNHSHGNPTLALTNLAGTTASNSAGLTLSLSATAQSVQPVAYSAANGSAAFSTLTFANSNGVSFSSGTQGLFATVRTDYQSAGAYLTTARASNDAIGLNTALTANGVSWTVNSSGLSLNVPAFLTTAALSNHSHGNPSLALTNLSGTTASNSAGLTLSLSAAAQSAQPVAYSAANGSAAFSTITFANSNGVSFSTGTQGLFATVRTDYQSAGAYLTTARASNDAIGLNTAATNVTWTVNSSGLSLNAAGYAGTGTTFNGANISGSMTVNSVGVNLSLSAAVGGGGGNTADTFYFAGNTTGTSSGTIAQSQLAISAAGALTGGWSNSSIVLSVPVISSLVGTGNVSISTNGNTISVSGFGAGTGYTSTTQAGSTVGVTQNAAGLSAAWPPYLTTQSVQTQPAGNIAGVGTTFAGTNVSASMTMNSNGLNLALSGVGGGVINQTGPNFADSATTVTAGTVVFSNANGVSFGLATNAGGVHTMTGSAAAGGAAYTAFSLQNRQLGASTTINSAGGQNSLWLAPVRVAAPVSASSILAAMMSYSGTITSAATAQVGHTIRVGIWSQNTNPASTSQFGTWWTGAISLTFWNSGTSSGSYAHSQSGGNTTSSSAGSNLLTASVMGGRLMTLPIGSTMSTGLYVIGVLHSTSSAGYSAAMSRIAMYMDNPLSLGMGAMGAATNNSSGYVDGGTYLTTTASLPATLALSQIGGVANVMPYFKVGAV